MLKYPLVIVLTVAVKHILDLIDVRHLQVTGSKETSRVVFTSLQLKLEYESSRGV